MVMKVLTENKVPLDKVIGICSDGASTMQGVHKDVCIQLAKRIRELRQGVVEDMRSLDHTRSIDSFHANKGVFVVHCVCHRLALILTDAVKGSTKCDQVIPEDCINLMTQLYTYFARSPARKNAMRSYIDLLNRDKQARLRARGRPTANVEIQNPVEELERVMDVLEERHKLPKKIVLTRWLSCADAVRVILSCRDVYTEFFLSESSEAASVIVELLEDSTVMAWCACMQDVLPVLTGVNILFQASKPLPHLLFSKITTESQHCEIWLAVDLFAKI